MNLEKMRRKIEKIDHKMVRLLEKRMELAVLSKKFKGEVFFPGCAQCKTKQQLKSNTRPVAALQLKALFIQKFMKDNQPLLFFSCHFLDFFFPF